MAQLNVRIDDDDLERVRDAAFAARLSLAAYVRRQLLDDSGQEAPPRRLRPESSPALPRVPTPKEALRARPRKAAECRHGLADCRVCKTGRFVE